MRISHCIVGRSSGARVSGIVEGEPVGVTSHRVEANGRMTLPQFLRPLLGFSFAIMPLPSPCLVLMPQDAFLDAVGEWRDKRSLFDPDVSLLDRYFVGNADVVTPDSQGRIVISPELRRLAKIHGDVSILAMRDRVEVWDAVTYEDHMRALTPERIQAVLNRKFGFQEPPAAAPEPPAAAPESDAEAGG